jgi:hypothetical protein
MDAKTRLFLVAGYCVLLARSIYDADVDFADVRSRPVVEAMFEVMKERNRLHQKSMEHPVATSEEALPGELDASQKELAGINSTLLATLETRLRAMGVKLEDEKVIEALTVAKCVLTFFGQIEETFRSE